jgi:hypothetical protein
MLLLLLLLLLALCTTIHDYIALNSEVFHAVRPTTAV